MRFEKIIEMNNAVIKIVRENAESYINVAGSREYYGTYNYLAVTISVNSNVVELIKDRWRKGFSIRINGVAPLTRGQRKKYLAMLRRLLGLSKREFCEFMGMLGGYWSIK